MSNTETRVFWDRQFCRVSLFCPVDLGCSECPSTEAGDIGDRSVDAFSSVPSAIPQLNPECHDLCRGRLVSASSTEFGHIIAFAKYDPQGPRETLHYSLDGAPPIMVPNSDPSADAIDPDVSAYGDDDFVLTWRSFESSGIHVRVVRVTDNAIGQIVSPPNATYTSMEDPQARPAVATFADGSFCLAHLYEDVQLGRRLIVRLYSASEPPVELASFFVTGPAELFGRIDLAASGSSAGATDARLVVVWEGDCRGGGIGLIPYYRVSNGLLSCMSAARAVPLVGNSPPTEKTIGDPKQNSVAILSDGSAVFGWVTNTSVDQNVYATVRSAPLSCCVGDFNGDGATDFDDFVILLANYNCLGECWECTGDLDRDGDVNFGDQVLFLADYGCTTP